MKRKRLLFVSTRFLLPIDSGGKVRTCQILRGMKGQEFEVTLACPATERDLREHGAEIELLCDRLLTWEPPRRNERLFYYSRLRHVLDRLPIPIRTDSSRQGLETVARGLVARPDVVVFDFLHAAVLRPASMETPSVLFTHNVEAEIFKRHAENTRNPLMRTFWDSQHGKMRRFEGQALRDFDVVVAVSDRDAAKFQSEYGVESPYVIPTGVDLDYFTYSDPVRSTDVVFMGSMDWLANQDAVRHFMDEIWSRVTAQVPGARMTVVGRAPPAGLVNRALAHGTAWRFTGFVDDVRPHVRGAAVCVVPIRVGGGTRLKVFEGMAMGVPIVSTSVGVEGLPIESGKHFLAADTPEAFGQAVVRLLVDFDYRTSMARAARQYVEERFSHVEAARAFSAGCCLAIERARRRRDPALGVDDGEVARTKERVLAPGDLRAKIR